MTEVENDRQRIARLEGSIRQLRRLATLALVAAAAPFALAATSPAPQRVAAQSFEVLDADGKARGRWSVDAKGATEFALLDRQQKVRAKLRVESDGRPSVGIFDAEGTPRARLASSEETTLNFYDRTGKLRTTLGVTSYGPGMNLPTALSEEGQDLHDPVAAFFAQEFESPAAAEAAFREAMKPQDGPLIQLYDEAGVARLEVRNEGVEPQIIFVVGKDRVQTIHP